MLYFVNRAIKPAPKFVLLVMMFFVNGSVVYAEKSSSVHEVEIKDFLFVPETIMVKLGDSISIINRDIAPHTATASDGSWDTDIINLGESKTMIVNRGMLQSYLCRFHPNMKGKMIIELD